MYPHQMVTFFRCNSIWWILRRLALFHTQKFCLLLFIQKFASSGKMIFLPKSVLSSKHSKNQSAILLRCLWSFNFEVLGQLNLVRVKTQVLVRGKGLTTSGLPAFFHVPPRRCSQLIWHSSCIQELAYCS